MALMSNALLFLATVLHLIISCVSEPCIFHHGPYQVIYGIRNGIVHFRVLLYGVPSMASGWTGIGFGNSMIEGLDTIVVRVANGRVSVSDEYVRGYTTSFPDRINNVVVQNSRIDGGTVSVTFSRPVHAVEYPYDSSLLGCQPWKFVIGLNRMGANGELHHHRITPIHRTVCIDECRI